MTNRYVLLVLVGACGSDPVSFSEPVGIELKAKSGDVAQNVVSEDKDITTESGNPYGAFVNDATQKLGHAPSRIEIDSLTLSLGADSTGVVALEEVVTGDVDVSFLVNDTSDTFDAAHVSSPTGVGPLDMDPSFDFTSAGAVDQARLLAGSFKVVLRAPAAAAFSGKGATATLETTFTFTAFD